MQPELYEDNIRKWLEANGTTVGNPTDKGRFASFLDLTKLKAAIEELIQHRTSSPLAALEFASDDQDKLSL